MLLLLRQLFLFLPAYLQSARQWSADWKRAGHGESCEGESLLNVGASIPSTPPAGSAAGSGNGCSIAAAAISSRNNAGNVKCAANGNGHGHCLRARCIPGDATYGTSCGKSSKPETLSPSGDDSTAASNVSESCWLFPAGSNGWGVETGGWRPAVAASALLAVGQAIALLICANIQ